MKYNFVTMVGLIFFINIQAGMASPNPKPDICPDVSMIQKVMMNNSVQQLRGGEWVANASRNRFGTRYCWAFSTSAFPANNKDEAIKKAQALLLSLRFVEGPVPFFSDWSCRYQSGLGYGYAVTPTFYDC
ncbi:MAG: DUF4949 domain-containing protein [Gammaproteobacteria bacterium]|nr:DUF4949 domain-containing protein [Gammaproteobacteria bacterium]